MNKDLHPILSRIIKKTGVVIDHNNFQLIEFIENVNKSLHTNDRERDITEHAFEVSESEYQNITKTLQGEAQQKNAFINQLKDTIHQLDDNVPNNIINADSKDLNEILNYLKELVVKQKETEKHLIQAKHTAEKAAAAKSEFLSIMSHEIRTPLNAIIGISHLLKEKQITEENIDALHFSSEHLLYLINDILDFSKLEEGAIQFQENEIHLSNLLDDLAKMSSYKAKEKNTLIQVNIDKALPEKVIGDILRLKQILSNLISNAVKFTENGTVMISCVYQSETSEKIDIKFIVKDNGIGIALEKQSQIFDKFTQAENNIAKEFGGTGLGLTITKKLLQLLNSDIYVESVLKKGAEFYFTLSLKKLTATTKHNTIFHLKKEDDLCGASILVVDDNKLNLLIAKQFLAKWNARVTICENGKNAIELVRKNSFDLVLMDLQMPEIDGFEAAAAIHSINNNIPIIALTASSTFEVQEKVKNSTMCDFIPKPFNADQMFVILSNHL
jgi:signal transduction histidine kinase/CheY-like chemotaxis protein